MRRGIAAGSVLAASCILFAGHPALAEGPTYSKDVAPILQKNCQDCHRPGQVAPFSLLTYEQARKRGSDIAHVTGERTMPPWPASTSFGGPFLDQRVLSDADLAKLREPGSKPAAPRATPRTPRPPRVRLRLAARPARRRS